MEAVSKEISETDKSRLTGGCAIARALVDNGVTHMSGVHGYTNRLESGRGGP